MTGPEAGQRATRVAATISGEVQGVGFRWFVVREGSRLGLVGWVANDADGSVRLEAEGDRGSIEQLLRLVREGPPGASVADVRVSELESLRGEARFSVRSLAHRGD